VPVKKRLCTYIATESCIWRIIDAVQGRCLV